MEIMGKKVRNSLVKCNTFEVHFMDYIAYLCYMLNGDASNVSGNICS